MGAFYYFGTANQGYDFKGIEIVLGSQSRGQGPSNRLLLCGNCPIKSHREQEGGIPIKGCPPDIEDIMETLSKL